MAIIKHADNPSARVLTPTGLLYVKDPPPDGGGGGLSGGGIAGVAVGAVAGAALLAAAGALWVQRMRRRRRQRAAAKASSAQLLRQSAGGGGVPGASVAEPAGPGPAGANALLVAAGLSPEAAKAAVGAAVAGKTSSPDPVPVSLVPPFSAGQLATPFALPPLPPGQHQRRWLGERASPGAGAADRELAIELQRAQQAELQQGAAAAAGLLAPLPPELQAWLVPSGAFAYQRLPDGRLQELGAGARWAVGPGGGCSGLTVSVDVFTQLARLLDSPSMLMGRLCQPAEHAQRGLN